MVARRWKILFHFFLQRAVLILPLLVEYFNFLSFHLVIFINLFSIMVEPIFQNNHDHRFLFSFGKFVCALVVKAQFSNHILFFVCLKRDCTKWMFFCFMYWRITCTEDSFDIICPKFIIIIVYVHDYFSKKGYSFLRLLLRFNLFIFTQAKKNILYISILIRGRLYK